MSRPWLLPALVFAVAFAGLALRGYPWQLAAVGAGAIGALTYAWRRTVQQMRKMMADHSVPSSLTEPEVDPTESDPDAHSRRDRATARERPRPGGGDG